MTAEKEHHPTVEMAKPLSRFFWMDAVHLRLHTADLAILAFAGGTMLYVISDEMIPETHAHGNEREATYTLLGGFCLMLVFDFLLG